VDPIDRGEEAYDFNVIGLLEYMEGPGAVLAATPTYKDWCSSICFLDLHVYFSCVLL
jgi:hypothetical protein